MDDKTEQRLFDALTILVSRMDEYNSTLSRLTVTVEEHERRSTLLEQQAASRAKEVDNKLGPISDHVTSVKAITRFLMWGLGGGSLLGISALIIKLTLEK